MAGLHGEVTILDGRAVVSRVRQGALVSGPPDADDRATLLTVAYVEHWHRATLDRPAGGADLERAVRDIAAGAGVDVTQPFAFVIEGELTALDMHVINGVCPMAAAGTTGGDEANDGDKAGPNAPWRLHLSVPAQVTLVGFHAQGREGRMTHHGTNVHLHAVLQHNGSTITGHVESVTVAAGSTVRVPVAP